MEYLFVGGLYPHERLNEISAQGDNSMELLQMHSNGLY